LDTGGVISSSRNRLDYKSRRNLGFKKTEHLIFCPLCKQLVLAVKIEDMSGSYERRSNCLIGFETEAWIYAYRMILSKLDSKRGQNRKMKKFKTT
jgi:hypothetical protein